MWVMFLLRFGGRASPFYSSQWLHLLPLQLWWSIDFSQIFRASLLLDRMLVTNAKWSICSILFSIKWVITDWSHWIAPPISPYSRPPPPNISPCLHGLSQLHVQSEMWAIPSGVAGYNWAVDANVFSDQSVVYYKSERRSRWSFLSANSSNPSAR